MHYGIIIATLNSEKTLNRTLNSITQQSLLPKQIWFVDGGSNDRTVLMIEQFIKSNPMLDSCCLIQKEKTGIYGAWNMALEKISTDLVFIIGSDDWYKKDTAHDVIHFFERNPDADILLGQADLYGENNLFLKTLKNKGKYFLPIGMPFVHPACFVRKNTYVKVGLFDSSFRVSGDYEFLYRSIKQGRKLSFIDKSLICVTAGGFSSQNKRLARRETCSIGLKYSWNKLLPIAAYCLRTLLGR